MRKTILSALAIIAIIVMLVVPMATPVVAAAPTLTSLTVADPGPNDGHPGQTLINVTILGTGFTSPASDNTLSFTNGDVTGIVTSISVPGVVLLAQISIAGNPTVPASTDLTLTNSGGTSNTITLTNFVNVHVPVFPEPPDGVTEAVGVSITPYIGGVPVAGNIHAGDVITYHVTLSMPFTGTVCYNFYSGTMAVRLPSSNTTYINVAGFGSVGPSATPSNPTGSTPVMPAVPEITKNAFMTFALPFTYTANPADLVDSGGGVMRLVAHVDYGIPDFPAINGGVSGTFEETVGIVGAHAGSINALGILGSLQVFKALDLGGAGPSGITGNFIVNVSGPNSFSQNLTFHMVDGVVSDSPQTINDLETGNYTVSEFSPGPNWNVTGGGGVSVTEAVTSNSTVTNHFRPGFLQVAKAIDLSGASGTGVSGNFTVTVTGPSYPGGTSHIFHMIDGVINPSSDSPWNLPNLIPGAYTVNETDPGTSWTLTISSGGNVTVTANQSASSLVTNKLKVPHTTVQTMSANPAVLPPTGGSVTITVTDMNDGTVPITGAYFILTGVPPFAGSPATMNLISSTDGDLVTMNPGATWTFTYTATIFTDTQFTAVGHGMANGVDVTGPSETRTIVVSTPRVPASSDLTIGLLIAGFAGAIAYLGLQRRRRAQQSK